MACCLFVLQIAGTHHLADDNMRRLLTMMGTRSNSQTCMTDTDQSEKDFQLQVSLIGTNMCILNRKSLSSSELKKLSSSQGCL